MTRSSRLVSWLFLHLLCAPVLISHLAWSEEIHVFSGGAPQSILQKIAPDFERATGDKLLFTFAIVTEIQAKLAKGEPADLVLLPRPVMDEVEKVRPVMGGIRVPVARVGAAVIYRSGAPAPDVSTPKKLKSALLAARAVALSGANTPNGTHVARMLSSMGIADAMKERMVARPAIEGGAELVASGQADMGIYLLSEVKGAPGTAVAGLLPSELQSFVIYEAAMPVGGRSGRAADFLSFAMKGENWQFWADRGFERGR